MRQWVITGFGFGVSVSVRSGCFVDSHDDLELLMLLFSPPKYWDYRGGSLYSVSSFIITARDWRFRKSHDVSTLQASQKSMQASQKSMQAKDAPGASLASSPPAAICTLNEPLISRAGSLPACSPEMNLLWDIQLLPSGWVIRASSFSVSRTRIFFAYSL